MTKPYLKRRRQVISALLLLVASFIIYSCSKGPFIGDDPTPDETAAQMKAWLQTQKTDTITAIAINRLIAQVNWNKAHTVTADSNRVYQIAALTDTTLQQPPVTDTAIIKYLVIYRQNGEVKEGYKLELYGKLGYLSAHADGLVTGFMHQKSAPLFGGNITRRTLTGRFSRYAQYSNGKLERLTVIRQKQVPGNVAQDKGAAALPKKSTGRYCIEWYLETYIDYVLVDSQYLGTTCEGGNCDYPTAVRNSRGTLSFGKRLMNDCSGGGGGGDGGSEPVEEQQDIIDSLTKPCFKEALNLYKFLPGSYGSMSEMGKILNLSFGLSNKWNIVFKNTSVVKDTNGNPLEASAQARYNPSDNKVIDVVVTLSETELASASREYTAATLLHEVMHAYFRQINGSVGQDHEKMANNYVTMMADALVSGFGITPEDATALAWGGLNENSQGVAITSAWTTFKNAHASDAATIQTTNTKYKTGKKVNIVLNFIKLNMKIIITTCLCLMLQTVYITKSFAQPENNIKAFEKDLYKRLNNEIHYYGNATEIFSLNIKINNKGDIDSTLISLSTPQLLRDRLNLMKSDFNFMHLKNEIIKRKWYNKKIIIPIYVLFESATVDTFKKITEHVNNKVKYSFVYDPISDDDDLENGILLRPLIFVFTQPVR